MSAAWMERTAPVFGSVTVCSSGSLMMASPTGFSRLRILRANAKRATAIERTTASDAKESLIFTARGG